MAASYLQQHPDAVALLDYVAGAGLTRVQCPWVLGPIQWREPQVKKAVCWLSQQVGLGQAGLRLGRVWQLQGGICIEEGAKVTFTFLNRLSQSTTAAPTTTAAGWEAGAQADR